MQLYRCLLDEEQPDRSIRLFVKFMYLPNDDWHDLNTIVKATLGYDYFGYDARLATEDEEIAYLDGKVSGIEEGYELFAGDATSKK